MINQTTYLSYLLLIQIQQYENTSGSGTRGYMLRKYRQDFFFFFQFLAFIVFLLYTKSIWNTVAKSS